LKFATEKIGWIWFVDRSFQKGAGVPFQVQVGGMCYPFNDLRKARRAFAHFLRRAVQSHYPTMHAFSDDDLARAVEAIMAIDDEFGKIDDNWKIQVSDIEIGAVEIRDTER